MKKFDIKRLFLKNNFKKTLGITFSIIGAIIIIQVIPVKFWILSLGIILVALGWTFYRMC
ncbi:hypothetical protein CLPU_5c00570 [Gottschalkia purinilytica]|uniref:Uncharacterized protein n=1 Tax=Gottschalkia purinilytica TaxID=1503 RepID=A0A0L0WBM8_GOTPU|nr:hypothetical protein [Gottschalkia purinilytica]KNF08750.1 hypothetical protein CLPU_5c00570 [Gottschalkia purinilytica]